MKLLICSADSAVHNRLHFLVTSSDFIFYLVAALPEVRVTPRIQSRRPGEDSLMKCHAVGVPFPKVSHSLFIYLDSSRRRSKSSGSVLFCRHRENWAGPGRAGIDDWINKLVRVRA